MAKPRRKFNKAFKLRTEEMSYESENIKELVSELGIQAELIYRWRAELARDTEKSFLGKGRRP